MLLFGRPARLPHFTFSRQVQRAHGTWISMVIRHYVTCTHADMLFSLCWLRAPRADIVPAMRGTILCDRAATLRSPMHQALTQGQRLVSEPSSEEADASASVS